MRQKICILGIYLNILKERNMKNKFLFDKDKKKKFKLNTFSCVKNFYF